MANAEPKEWVCSVYAISDGIGNMKFGVAKNVPSRMKSLQTGNAHPLQLLFVVECCSSNRWVAASVAHRLEWSIHKNLSQFRMAGEWFAIDYHGALEHMEACVEHVSSMPWGQCDNVRLDGVFIERREPDHIWYWPTNDAHARGLIGE